VLAHSRDVCIDWHSAKKGREAVLVVVVVNAVVSVVRDATTVVSASVVELKVELIAVVCVREDVLDMVGVVVIVIDVAVDKLTVDEVVVDVNVDDLEVKVCENSVAVVLLVEVEIVDVSVAVAV